jgi:uncharacterized protein (DUF2384 family)
MARERRAKFEEAKPSVEIGKRIPSTPAKTPRKGTFRKAAYHKVILALNSARRKENLPALKYEDLFPSLTDAQGQEITAQSIKAHALDTFGTAEKAEHWMSRPNPLFHRKTPLRVIQSDPSSVEAELVRIDHGFYI